jgi:hypothetical protein
MNTRVRLLPVRTVALALLTMAIQGRSADYPTTVSSFSPLAYWRLNETAVAPAQNSVANSGTVGSIANGYVVLDAIKGQAGIVGNSVRFNNPGGAVAYCGSKIDVPFNPGINPGAPFSVEFWAKPNDTGIDSGGISDSPLSCFNQNWFGGANRSGWLFYLNHAGQWQFRLGLTSGYAAICTASGGNATVGTWQHLAATFDGTTVRLYVNGTQVGSIAAAAGWAPNTQTALRMGGTPLNGALSDGVAPGSFNAANQGNSGNRGFDGWVDEVAVFPTLLSQATIKSHFDAATTNNAGYHAQIVAAGPVGYWGLDETAVIAPDPSTFPILANSGSLATDADGTNMWGSLTAQPGSGFSGMGLANSAIKLDGVNGYVALKDAPGLHFSGNITMMAWIKPAVQDFWRDIIAHGWDGGHAETFLRISRGVGGTGAGDGDYYEVGVTDNSGYYDAAFFPIPPGDIGNWVHLAGTYDGAKWNLYRNGVLAASVTSTNGARDVTNRWSIGSRTGPSPTPPTGYDAATAFAAEGLFFGGSMDEPAIFNTAIAAADIATIYASAQAAPQITRAVQLPGSVFKGQSASFNVWAEGAPTLSYLWYSNNVPTGVTTTNYTPTNIQVGTQNISVIVTNLYGSATSSVSFVVVAAPPSFTLQPASLSLYSGRPFSFSVTTAGSSPMSLQWKTNGVPIPGATSSTYSGTASAATAGSYICTASNEVTQVDSLPGVLTVITPPTGYGAAVMADNPVAFWRLGESSGTIAHDYYNAHDGTYVLSTLGQTGYSELDADTAVSFSGTNSHVANINGTNGPGVNFSGHTNFTLEVWVNGAAGQADESTIIAKGNGANGTTASEQFSLDVQGGKYHFFTRGGGNSIFETFADSGPDGTWQHVVCVYDDLNVYGGGKLLYIFVNGAAEGAPAATRSLGLRASSDPVSIGSKRLGNSPAYDGTFSGIVDEVAVYSYALPTNNIAAHYAAAYGTSLRPIISKQPVSQTNYINLQTKFSVGAYGTQPLTYQWKHGGVDLTDGGNIAGASTHVLIIDPVTLADAGTYSVNITNVNGTTNSATATFTVRGAPTNTPFVPGLVLHMPFNNSLADTSGRGNNGTGIHITTNVLVASSGTTNVVSPNGSNPDFNYVSDGVLGTGLHYATYTVTAGNGTVTNSYFVKLGDIPDLHFGSNVNFSVAYWVRFPAFNGQGDLGDLPFLGSGVNSYGALGFTFAPSYQLGSWSYSMNGAVQLYGPDYAIDDGVWHHLAHTFNRTGKAITYLDGREVDSRNDSAIGNLDTGNSVSIGQDPTGTYPEQGYYDLDDLGVWRRDLSAFEVQTIYIAGLVSGLSFVDITPTITVVGSQVRITYQAGTLQSADFVNGPYTDVPGASSPYTITPTGNKFYRTHN